MLRQIVPSLAAIACTGSLLAADADDAPPPPVPAADPDAPLVISATLLDDQPLTQPYAYYQHDREELDQRIGRTALDRINYRPGVFIQHTAPAQTSPFIRGLTGEQTLLLVDGIRLSHATMRPGPNQYAALIPDVSIDRIDAILGPSAAATGSDGLTGLIDLRLADAGRGATEAVEPWIRGRVDHANGTQLAGGIDGRQGDWAYSVELGLKQFHNRIGGHDAEDNIFGDPPSDNSIPNTGYDQTAVAARVAYTGLPDHHIELKSGYLRQDDAPRPDGYFANSGKSDRISRFFDPQEYTYVHLSDRWRPDAIEWLDSLDTTLWLHVNDERQMRERVRGPGYRREVKNDTTTGIGLKSVAQSRIGDDHRLSYGIDFSTESTSNDYARYEGVDRDSAVLVGTASADTRTTIPDGSTYQTIALFGQDRWQIDEQWELLVGARASFYSWEADVAGRDGFAGVDTVDGDTSDISGGVRVSWQVTEPVQLWAGVGRAFRAPNLTNLTGITDRGSSGINVNGNPDLDPEVSYTVEVGSRWMEELDLVQIALFATQVDDLIQPVYSDTDSDGMVDSGVMTNAEGADLAGAELQWDYGLPLEDWLPWGGRLAFMGSASLVDAEIDITQADGSVRTDNLSRANRLYGTVGLHYQPEAQWWSRIQVRWHDSYDDVAESDAGDVRLTVPGDADGAMPGYAVLDLLAGWTSPDGDKHLTAFIENVFDRSYREPGSGADAVGLNVGVGGGIRF